jgi:DNA-directed RNA polymerase specialized sigma24 family protein
VTDRQNEEIAARILAAMSRKDREALIRFYVDGHRAERIQQELGLTNGQFKSIKARAKAIFAAGVQGGADTTSIITRIPMRIA